MDNIRVVKKGYTISVTSWENDADNYKTETMTVEDKDYALAVLQMCKDIFVSCNNGDGGIGNANGSSEEENARQTILDYVADKPMLVKYENDPDYKIDIIMDINQSLMGYSEWYYSRVFESGFITYAPEDIMVEKIA